MVSTAAAEEFPLAPGSVWPKGYSDAATFDSSFSTVLLCSVVAAVILFWAPEPLLVSSVFTQIIPFLAASSGLFKKRSYFCRA